MTPPKLRVITGDEPHDDESPQEFVCFTFQADENHDPEQRRISKIGGLPYWPADNPWPCCSGCGKPLTFLFQVRTEDVLQVQFGSPRMLCFFYCYPCHPWWDIDGKGFLLTHIPYRPQDELLAAKYCPLDTGPAPQPCAIRFRRHTDYPSLSELSSLPEDEHLRALFLQRYPQSSREQDRRLSVLAAKNRYSTLPRKRDADGIHRSGECRSQTESDLSRYGTSLPLSKRGS